ncbi:MAG: hypothetical protein NPIRA05_22830 [Nitrospirales bacterium]|nr:MAG: hypothetical protein NPIRA05_22830 [Nitrospirales bacterium]
MHGHLKHLTKALPIGCLISAGLLLGGCISPYESRHENQWDAREQIWMSEASQVKLRAAQSRVFDTTDRRTILKAILSTMQDLNVQLEVLDEELGIVSGKYFAPLERPEYGYDPLYHLYDNQSLLVFGKTYLSWGPFWHRNDVVRLTVTVRPRNEKQLVVRASAQFYLRAVEDPEPYQKFFRSLEQALFLEAALAQEHSEVQPNTP